MLVWCVLTVKHSKQYVEEVGCNQRILQRIDALEQNLGYKQNLDRIDILEENLGYGGFVEEWDRRNQMLLDRIDVLERNLVHKWSVDQWSQNMLDRSAAMEQRLNNAITMFDGILNRISNKIDESISMWNMDNKTLTGTVVISQLGYK